MELRHLRYFLKVAEELHFGKAAEKLGIAQPPLSQQIKALEQEIGAPLFLRTKRHVELTASGKFFLGEARNILTQTERAIQTTRRVARGETGRLVVGFVSSSVYGKFPSIFRMMREKHPGVALVLQDLTSEEQVDAMKAHRLDVGFVRPPVVDAESLEIKVILEEPFIVALPETHPLSSQKKIALKQLADESFLQVPRHLGPGFYDQFIHLCALSGFTPKVVQETRSTQTIVSLISAGLGVSIVPASLENFQHTGVVYRRLTHPTRTIPLAVMWRPHDTSPALRSFLEIVRKVMCSKGKPREKARVV